MDPACENRLQQIYCLACLQDNKHPHKVITLPNFLREAKTSCDLFKESVDTIHHTAVARYEKLRTLVEYLESNNQGLIVADYKHITKDMSEILNLKAQSDDLQAILDDVYVVKDVSKFIETHGQIERLREVFRDYEYLDGLSEDLLFRNFLSIWPTNIDMSDLSQDDKFTVINLKIRYLNSLQQPTQPAAFLGPDASVRAHMKDIYDKLQNLE